MRIEPRRILSVMGWVVTCLLVGFAPVSNRAQEPQTEAPAEEAEIVDEFEWVDAGDAEGPSRLIRLMGRSHILLVHFPIAWMWLAAAVNWARLRWPSPIGRWDLVLIGLTIMALVPSLATGWIHHLHIGDDADMLSLLQWHKIFAFVTLGVVGSAFLVRFFSGNGPVNSGHRLAGMIMLVGAIAVSVTAHFGGSMVHGADFLYLW